MQFLKVFRRNGIRLSHQFDGGGRAGDSTDPAADTPFFIHYGEIAFHPDHIDGANINARPAPDALFLVRLPEKVSGHQDVSRDLLSADRPHGPATTAPAVAGMFASFACLI